MILKLWLMIGEVNRNMLVALKPAGSSPSTMLVVAKRSLNTSSEQFVPVNADAQVVRELPDDRILVPGVSQLDGQYVILITDPKSVGVTGSGKYNLELSDKRLVFPDQARHHHRHEDEEPTRHCISGEVKARHDVHKANW